MPITAALLTGALAKAGGADYSRAESIDSLVAHIHAGLAYAQSHGVKLTPQGVAAYVAQPMQESLFFHYTQEKLSRYPSSWSLWKGRGYIGCTGKPNYLSCSSHAYGRGITPTPSYFVDNRAQLADPRFAWLTVDWFFTSQVGLWALACAGNNFAVSQWVNGGPNRVGTSWIPLGWYAKDREPKSGKGPRQVCHEALLSYGDQLLPAAVKPPAPVYVPGATLRRGDTGARVKHLQDVLRVHFHSKVSADGIYGPYTEAVIRAVQKANRLVVDGVCGPATLRFIWTKTKEAI